MSEGNTQNPTSSAVVDIIDEIIGDLPGGWQYMQCRKDLDRLRDGIFLELPEDRLRLLRSVGEVLNAHIPVGWEDSVDAAALGRIKEFMIECFHKEQNP